MTITIRKQLAADWYKTDPADPQSAEFHIKPLNQLQFIGLRNEIGFNDFERLTITSVGVRVALDHGLLDWKGVLDETGQPLEFNRENRDMLPIDVLTTLAFEIANRSRLSDEQKKSSPSPST